MRRYDLIAILALIAICGVMAFAKPERKDAAKPTPEVPDVSFSSNWGEVTQAGRTLSIDGHPTWCAKGEFRKDGSVLIVWTLNENGRVAPGVYHWKDGALVGTWGYAEDVKIEEDGKLTGATQHDRIYKLPLPGLDL